MKKLLLGCVFLCGIFTLCPVFAGNNTNNSNNYIIINNIIPQYSSYGYGGNIMCTDRGGFCANSNYIMSTRRTVYAPSQWRRQTLREKRLSYGNRYSSYEY